MSTRRHNLNSVGINIGQVPSANTGLWLDKYILDLTKSDAQGYSNFLKEVSSHSTSTAYTMFFKHWEKMLGEYKAKMLGELRTAKVNGRMIVGLGDESVLETSIALHHTYGVPYIPGSALKGLASSYAHQKLGENWRKGSAAHNILFGNTDEAGYITFFDALYVPDSGHHGQALYPDIITVHHQDYYNTGKDSAPADWDSPNPIPFLSVTGSYLIALAAPDLPANNEWVLRAFDILEQALKEIGIGAKTSSGYGRMILEKPPVDPDIQKAEGYKKEIERMPDSNVAGQIQGYYQKWQQIKSAEARKTVAQAIIDKVRHAGREKASLEKSWYQDLLNCLDKK